MLAIVTVCKYKPLRNETSFMLLLALKFFNPCWYLWVSINKLVWLQRLTLRRVLPNNTVISNLNCILKYHTLTSVVSNFCSRRQLFRNIHRMQLLQLKIKLILKIFPVFTTAIYNCQSVYEIKRTVQQCNRPICISMLSTIVTIEKLWAFNSKHSTCKEDHLPIL